MIIWNQQIINKQKGCQPDLTVIDREKKQGILIDIAIVNTKNMKNTFTRKKMTYRETEVLVKQEY